MYIKWPTLKDCYTKEENIFLDSLVYCSTNDVLGDIIFIYFLLGRHWMKICLNIDVENIVFTDIFSNLHFYKISIVLRAHYEPLLVSCQLYKFWKPLCVVKTLQIGQKKNISVGLQFYDI